MVALVENEPADPAGGIQVPARRLDHHQGMIGHHEADPTRLAHAVLDEAAAVVGAGGIDALAPVVAERQGGAPAHQVGQPGRKTAAAEVAAAGPVQPAGHQAQRHGVERVGAAAPHRLLEVQQAQVVLAALAQHHPVRLDPGIGIEPVQLAVDLMLQVAGKGGQPHGHVVLIRPQACGGDVAEGLADPGPGLGQDHQRRAFHVGWREGGGDRRRVVRLAGTGFRIAAQQGAETRARFGRLHRGCARRRRWRLFLPFGQPAPHVQPRRAGPGTGAVQVRAQA